MLLAPPPTYLPTCAHPLKLTTNNKTNTTKQPVAFGAKQGSRPVDPHEPCRMEGWARLRDGRWPCLRSMALFNDGFPSPIHSHQAVHGAGHHGGLWVWVPTLELTTHFWERPPKRRGPEDADRPAPYLRLRFATSFVRRGLLMCDSEVRGNACVGRNGNGDGSDALHPKNLLYHMHALKHRFGTANAPRSTRLAGSMRGSLCRGDTLGERFRPYFSVTKHLNITNQWH